MKLGLQAPFPAIGGSSSLFRVVAVHALLVLVLCTVVAFGVGPLSPQKQAFLSAVNSNQKSPFGGGGMAQQQQKDTGFDVELLDLDGWQKLVKSRRPSVVHFFTPWCTPTRSPAAGPAQSGADVTAGHKSKELSHKMKQVADWAKGMINVAAMNCDNELNKALCLRQGVEGAELQAPYGGARSLVS